MKIKNRDQKERIIGLVRLFFFLALAMLGFYILQISTSQPGSVIGWLVFIGFLLASVDANRYLDRVYLRYPDKRKPLVNLMIISGVAVGLIFGDLESPLRISPIRLTLATFGACWAFSGVYLLLRRNLDL